jgi:glucokinase
VKRVVLVNGVPASGKSTVARALADATGWPLLTLDTVKEALFAHLGTGDREYNRKLGRASYQAMFALIGDFPPDATAIVDAWFGFQPREALDGHLARAGAGQAVEVWVHARPETIGARYAARVGERSAGHLGLEYVPELMALARRARPLGGFARLDVDGEGVVAGGELAGRVAALFASWRAA